MEIKEIKYSSHAIHRMFERGINIDCTEEIINSWNVIADYPDDKPYPGVLLLGYFEDTPIHIVAGIDYDLNICYIITVYEPDSKLWLDDFTRRR